MSSQPLDISRVKPLMELIASNPDLATAVRRDGPHIEFMVDKYTFTVFDDCGKIDYVESVRYGGSLLKNTEHPEGVKWTEEEARTIYEHLATQVGSWEDFCQAD